MLLAGADARGRVDHLRLDRAAGYAAWAVPGRAAARTFLGDCYHFVTKELSTPVKSLLQWPCCTRRERSRPFDASANGLAREESDMQPTRSTSETALLEQPSPALRMPASPAIPTDDPVAALVFCRQLPR